MFEMTVEEKRAYAWALAQPFESVAARNARILARYIERSLAGAGAGTAEEETRHSAAERGDVRVCRTNACSREGIATNREACSECGKLTEPFK